MSDTMPGKEYEMNAHQTVPSESPARVASSLAELQGMHGRGWLLDMLKCAVHLGEARINVLPANGSALAIPTPTP